MYIVKNLCSPSGSFPRNRTMNHAMNATITTPSVQMPSQTKWGIVSNRRKKTVSRVRPRSSMTRTRTGLSGGVVKRFPEVETGQRSVRPPCLGDLLHRRRLRQFLQAVVHLHRLPDPEVADGQDVRSPEM